jgi:hypothetical protein
LQAEAQAEITPLEDTLLVEELAEFNMELQLLFLREPTRQQLVAVVGLGLMELILH